jgi:hypothetical protein
VAVGVGVGLSSAEADCTGSDDANHATPPITKRRRTDSELTITMIVLRENFHPRIDEESLAIPRVPIFAVYTDRRKNSVALPGVAKW